MRLAPLWLTATLSVSLLAGAAAARASLPEYLAARRAAPPKAGLTVAMAQNDPIRYQNTVLEVKGSVVGVSHSGSSSNLLLKPADGDVLLLRGDGDADMPGAGETVRALASMEEGGQFHLIAAVSEAEVADAKLDAPRPAPMPPSRMSRWPVRVAAPTFSRSGVASRSYITSDIVDRYKAVIQGFNPRLSAGQLDTISRSVLGFSYKYGVDARLVMAFMATESSFKLKARSRTGAMGLGQLMPGTARSLGVRNAYDPVDNIGGMVKLISRHIAAYGAMGKGFALVCSAYNAGPNAVKKYGGIPPYRETQAYVTKVAYYYRMFAPELFQK